MRTMARLMRTSRTRGTRRPGRTGAAVPALTIALLTAGCASGRSPTPAPPAPPPAPTVRQRPLPYPIVPPLEYRLAARRGTRTRTGEPGPRYWTQWPEYTIETSVDPKAKRVEGSEEVVYHNRSPDTLGVVYVYLLQNFHAPGVQRGESAEVTGGMKLSRVAVGGMDLQQRDEAPGYSVDGTIMRIDLPAPIAPGATSRLAFDWSFKLPQSGISGRMGWSDDDLVFLAYFYPQIAVYDDVAGWATDPFMGTAEFYDDVGSYDVTVSAPEGWIVNGTGTLENEDEVLQPEIVQRIRRAERSDHVVHVITASDFGHATQSQPGGDLSWHFVADSVRDVAYSITSRSNWDAMRTDVGDRDGDGAADYARADAIWRASAPGWSQAVLYAAQSIHHHSLYTGLSYPWPHMTAVEGADIIGGGMEYPMMTLIGAYNGRPATALFGVVAHELAHMWVPMVVNNNERRYAWMDEGTTEYNEDVTKNDLHPETKPFEDELGGYRAVALTGVEDPIMRWSDLHRPSPVYTIATYNKPALVLHALRGMLGDSVFLPAYHAFFKRWAWKHPYPWDFFETFQDVTGRDLEWFFRAWYYQSTWDGIWILDQAVDSVVAGADSTRITIHDNGWVPMPTPITVTRANGDTLHLEVPVQHWLDGATSATVAVPAAPSPVRKVEIDAGHWFPDAERRNNVWTAGAGAGGGASTG